MSNDQFDLGMIRADTFLADLVYHESIDSTNTELNRLLEKPLKSPTLVLANSQSAGRGRREKQWWSGPGSLTFSLLMDFPMLSPEQLNGFSLTTGLAVCQTIEKLAPLADIALKWPNDVYFNRKKVCGILIERPNANEPRLIIGVGINVNNSFSETNAPAELRDRATSLIDELGTTIDRTQLLIEFLKQMEIRSRDQIHQPESLLQQWRAYSLLTARTVTVQMAAERIEGVCQGIGDHGELLLAVNGQVRPIVAGEVIEFR